LGRDLRGSHTQLATWLRVGQRLVRGLRKGWTTQPGHRVAAAHGFSSVLARIDARWTVCTPVFNRDKPPPICIRHELSPAHSTCAPVSSTLRILSASIAVDVSEFFSANVPPKDRKSTRLNSSHVKISY